MSCFSCRVLGLGCGDACVLRSCLQSIESLEAQANAITFLGNFFGPNNFIAFVSAVSKAQRMVLFRSLLLEACGRMVNPVDGVVGLLGRSKWDVCQKAVDTVLARVLIRSLLHEACGCMVNPVDGEVGLLGRGKRNVCQKAVDSMLAGGTLTPIPYNPHQSSALTLSLGPITTNPKSGTSSGNDEKKLLNLFV